MSQLLLSAFSSLALVLGALLAGLWVVRRLGSARGQRGPEPALAVVSRLNLARNQGIALVRCGDQTLLVSYGEGGVHRIDDAPKGDAESAGAARSAEGPGDRPDAQTLRLPVGGRARRLLGLGLVTLTLVGAWPAAAMAQTAPPPPVTVEPLAGNADALDAALGALPQLSVAMGGEGEGLRLDGTVGTVVLLGLMAVAPTLLLLTTSFTRILVVLHFLRQALGTQNTPPGHLLAALALLLTGVVMAPTFNEINQSAVQPWVQGTLDEGGMMRTAMVPLRGFMLDHTHPEELQTFLDLTGSPPPLSEADIPSVTLITAFALSELRAAFEIGFALFLPFVVIDLVVAAVLTSMGMFMLPPTMIALPCKLMLFVLMDGWSLVVTSLVQSFV